MKEFHITQDTPIQPNWPNGAWSLYEITGAQIAERTIWTKDSGKYEIAERWPWPGYVGMFETFEQIVSKIEELIAA